jgi:hypothetical protein
LFIASQTVFQAKLLLFLFKYRPLSKVNKKEGFIFGLLILKNSKMADLCYSGKIEWPRHVDPVAKDLIKKLLVQVVFHSFEVSLTLIYIDKFFECFYILYSTRLHLQSFRFQCIGGCWYGTRDCYDFGICIQTL